MSKSNNHSTSPLTDFMFHKACVSQIPLSGTFELSPVCNFSCKMCYVRKTAHEVNTSDRPILSLDQWIQIAKEAREAGMLYLLLTGGEPLLWPDFWELYEQLNRMGFILSINTNGALIDDAAVRQFKRFPPRRINITLYGASDGTYKTLCGVDRVFSKVDYAITALQKAGIQVKLNSSLTPYNAEDLEELVKYAKERELILQAATYMFPPIRRECAKEEIVPRFTPEETAFYRLKSFRLQYGEEQYQAFLEDIVKGYASPPGLDGSCIDPLDGKMKCRAGKASFWITWNGWMISCGMMPEPKVELVNRSFQEAWKELAKISKDLVLSGTCDKCSNRKLCIACAAMAYAEAGKTSGIPVYLCKMVQEMKRLAQLDLKIS